MNGANNHGAKIKQQADRQFRLVEAENNLNANFYSQLYTFPYIKKHLFL